MSSKIFQTALWAVDGIGLRSFRKVESFLQNHKLSWAEWWHSDAGLWWASGLRPHQQAAVLAFKNRYTPESYVAELHSKGIWIVTEQDELYPALLRPLPDRPPVLFGKGNRDISQRAIAIVGTRHITSYGRQVTEQLVKELVAHKVLIVSGFMYGVDVVAQKTANECQGRTVGVLGYGFNHLYPAHQRHLFDQLLAAGQTFITEYAPHVPPSKGTFICRNRIIAGLSQAIVVTEAGIKSGSHGTANWALEYGRSVCAVPGSITNPYSQGTKWLINQGARLVDCAQDVFEELNWKIDQTSRVETSPDQSGQLPLDPGFTKIMAELRSMRQSTEQLSINCGLSVSKMLTSLTHLELAKQVKREGPYWTLW